MVAEAGRGITLLDHSLRFQMWRNAQQVEVSVPGELLGMRSCRREWWRGALCQSFTVLLTGKVWWTLPLLSAQ